MKRLLRCIVMMLIASLPHFNVVEGQTTFTFERAWPDSLIGRGMNILSMLRLPSGTILAGVTFDGLWKSADDGSTWSRVTSLGDNIIFDLLLTKNGDVFAISSNLYRSSDNGVTWERLDGSTSSGLPQSLGFGLSLAESPKGDLFLGWNEGIFKSTNGGATWSAANKGLPKFQRTIPPYDSMVTLTSQFAFHGDTVFVCTGGSDFYPSTNGIYRSTNHGDSWSPSYSGVPIGHPFRAIRTSQGVIVAGGPLYNVRTIIPQRGIWRSSDCGRNWKLSGFDYGIWTFEIGMDGSMYAGNGDRRGLYYSRNVGVNWEYIGLNGYDVQSIVFLNDTTFLVGTNDGVFKGVIRPLIATNQPPVLSLSSPNTTYGGVTFKAQYFAYDTDPGDKVSVALDYTSSPPWLLVDSVRSEVRGVVPFELHGKDFQFRIVATDTKGAKTTATSPLIRVGRLTKVEDEAAPTAFALAQNYPNPFNPKTSIQYSVASRSHVKLTIYNTIGGEIRVLVEGTKEPGTYHVTWDARGYPSGMYFYRMEAGAFVQTKKILLLR